MYANCEQVLLKGTLRELVSQNVNQLCEFYTKFDSDILRIQLSIAAESYYSFRQGEGVGDTLHNVIDFLKKNKNIWSFILWSRGFWLCQQQMPALNAPSVLRRVKSYLPTSMSNKRLNHLMTCTVHKSR